MTSFTIETRKNYSAILSQFFIKATQLRYLIVEIRLVTGEQMKYLANNNLYQLSFFVFYIYDNFSDSVKNPSLYFIFPQYQTYQRHSRQECPLHFGNYMQNFTPPSTFFRRHIFIFCLAISILLISNLALPDLRYYCHLFCTIHCCFILCVISRNIINLMLFQLVPV